MLFRYNVPTTARPRHPTVRHLAPASTPFEKLPFPIDASHLDMLCEQPVLHLGLSSNTWVTFDAIDNTIVGLAVGDFAQMVDLFLNVGTGALRRHMISFLQTVDTSAGSEYLAKHHQAEFDELFKEFDAKRRALGERYAQPMDAVLLAQEKTILDRDVDARIEYQLSRQRGKRILASSRSFWDLASRHRDGHFEAGVTNAYITRTVNGSERVRVALYKHESEFWYFT